MLSPLHLTPIHWTVAAVLSNSRLSLQASIEFVSSGDDSSPFANLTWSPTPDHLVSNEVGMTTTTQPKASMHILKTSADPLVSSVALWAPCETSGSAAPTTQPGADTEVVPRARRRRQFFNADKRRILDAADRCTQPGEIGALLRREGVYSSSLSTWRRQREVAELAALAPQKRGGEPVDRGRGFVADVNFITCDDPFITG